MRSWFVHRAHSSKALGRHARPSLETLEDRNLLAVGLGIPPIALNVVPLSANSAQISGTVGAVGGVQITFGDAASGTTTTNNSGAFSVTEQNLGVGIISASGTWGSSKTGVAQSLLEDVATNMVVAVNFGANNAITLNGLVLGSNPGGQSVALSGDVTGTVVTGSGGGFSATGSGTSGNSAAILTVPGHAPGSPIGIPTQNPGGGGSGGGGGGSGGPVITSFSAISGPNGIWTFSGSVSDSNESGILVHLCMPDGTAQTVTCDGSGNFSICMTLAAGVEGFASAVATDAAGATSAAAEYLM
jgi:hypothetical protein